MHIRTLPSFLVITAILISSVSADAAAFIDTQSTPYAIAYEYLSRNQILSGYSDGTGRPYAQINRAEVLKVILSMRSEDKAIVDRVRKNLPPLPLFSDIDQRSWYAPYVEAGFERSIVKGYPDGSFQPARAVTVEESIALLLRAYGEKDTAGAAKLSPYIENRDNQWFTSYVNMAITKNLIMHSGKLRLGSPITRGEFFDIAYRLHDSNAKKQTAFAGSEPTTLPIRMLTQRPQPTTAVISAGQPVIPQNVSPYASQKHFAISMPSIGITDLAVIHPTDPFTSQGVLAPLQNGVGHLFSTPGGGGKILIYGHSSGYPWDKSQFTKIFRKINELKTGDKVYVTYDGKLNVYEVTYEESVPAGDTSRYNDDGKGEELILYTCWPPDSISQRYLVHAVPVQQIALR